MKVWLFQNVIAPYRIRLFEEMAKTPGVDFKVVLLANGMKNLPHWRHRPEDMPFPAERIPGLHIRLGYERIVCINPSVVSRLFGERPDVLICAGFSFATVLALLYKRIAGRRYVIWMEGTRHTEVGLSHWRLCLRKALARGASAFVDAGTLSRDYLYSLLPPDSGKRSFTSYNCVEAERFARPTDARPEVEELRRRLPRRNVLYVGQLLEVKGVIQLMEAYRRLCEGIDDPVGLILVGQGPLDRYVREFAERHGLENVHLEGAVEYRDVPKYFWAADVFALLGIRDRNPLVLFEALAAGLPVVCSARLGNARDFVSDGRNGYIVDPFDIRAVAEKIGNVLSWDRDKRRAALEYTTRAARPANYRDSAKAFLAACAVDSE